MVERNLTGNKTDSNILGPERRNFVKESATLFLTESLAKREVCVLSVIYVSYSHLKDKCGHGEGKNIKERLAW